MLTRRSAFAAAIPVVIAGSARAAGSFQSFVAGVYAEASGEGIRRDVLDAAFAGVTPNQEVIAKDQKQAEFTMTWAQYRALVINDQRIADGRAAVARDRALFAQVEARFGVGAPVIAGIWGLESSFGTKTGNYKVVEALATLAWEGRRAAFFRGELMAALKILNNGDITPPRMTGSYAGAMGQPQFMPSSYLRLAVDFDGDGTGVISGPAKPMYWPRSPITSHAPVGYGRRDLGPAGHGDLAGPAAQGRDVRRPLAEWARQGIVPASGKWAAPGDTPSAVIAPDAGSGGETRSWYSTISRPIWGFTTHPTFMR